MLKIKKAHRKFFFLCLILVLVFIVHSSAAAQEPTAEPTQEATVEPTEEATAEPTEETTTEPTQEPTAEPTQEATVEPTEEATVEPTGEATAEPTGEPTVEPTEEPTVEPTVEPTTQAVSQTFTATLLTPISSETVSKGGSVEAARQSVTAASGDLVSVIVQLEDASLAAYEGGVPGLPPTSPEVTGAEKLNPASAESQLYLDYLLQQQSAFEGSVTKAAPGARIVHRYQVVLNGISMLVAESQVEAIAKLPGVKAVYPDEPLQLETERSPFFIDADRLWKELGGQEHAGEGVIVGVLDSGIWPEHPSFADPDPLGQSYAEPPAKWTGTACEFGSAISGDIPFTCNNKLIGAQRFMATYDLFIPLLPGEFISARDDNGHGTHTASTAAGNAGVEATIFDIPRGTISGMAPRAHVVAYKVCGEEGCFPSDAAAAIQQAILDGVDVLNFSIGGGATPYADGVELAFLDAYAAGVFVAASAGNDGPDPDTVEHRGPWVTTVGASTTSRHFLSTVTLAADNGDKLELTGVSLTRGIITPTLVVNAEGVGDALCLDGTPDGAFSGKVVVCQGAVGRLQKSFNVLQRGGVGMLLYNPVLASVSSDSHYVPSVHLQNDAGAALLNFLAGHTGVTATFPQGEAARVRGDVMAAFSSRGGPEQTLGISKPDVTAPGAQILAGNTPDGATVFSGPPGELFQAIQGTSMSSPHVAGVGALLRDLYPDWTPGQIKSALMTTAQIRGVNKEDRTTRADPFDFGSGRIDLFKAWHPGVTFDVTAQDYIDHEEDLWNANYPSLYLPVMPGRITVERTAHDVQGVNSRWILSARSGDDWSINVPRRIDVPANGEASFEISIDARDVPLGEVRHGEISLSNGHDRLHIPVTIVRNQPVLTMAKSCTPDVFQKGQTTDCTITLSNTSLDNANVNLVDELPVGLTLVPGSVISATESGNGLTFSGVLTGAEPPLISVAPGTSPVGYLPLSLFGVEPIDDIGDETIANFSVPAFLYGGETYTDIGIVSNGYAVVGGGTGADVDFINQILPDPTPPNNVLAPFWTDLDPGVGGGLRIAILTDGVNSWVVLDWEAVPNFSDGELNSFQIWIGINGVEDISFTYDAVSDGDGGFLTVGAENRFGNSGSNFYADGVGTLPTAGTELRVTSIPGSAGETLVITFQAKGSRAVYWQNCAELTSDIFQGVSLACFRGRVK